MSKCEPPDFVLLLSIKRMLRVLEELVLKAQTFLVCLDGANCVDDLIGPRLHIELAELLRRRGAFSSVVIRESRVPPDAGVNTFGKIQPFLIGTRLAGGTIQV